jgi:hypothetical protein
MNPSKPVFYELWNRLAPHAHAIQKETKRDNLDSNSFINARAALRRRNKLYYFTPLQGGGDKSAAEVIQDLVNPVPVVSAFQTVPAAYLNNIDAVLNLDVLLARRGRGGSLHSLQAGEEHSEPEAA